MKRVLLVSYYFLGDNIGSLRLRGLFKYLPENGWEPTILTSGHEASDGEDPRIIPAPHNDILSKIRCRLTSVAAAKTRTRRTASRLGCSIGTTPGLGLRIWDSVLSHPDECRGWYRPALRAASSKLSESSVDAIVSSSYPPTCHLVGRKLKECWNVPWIADFRDLWSQNHYYPLGEPRRSFDRDVEMRVIATADALTTVSMPLADSLGALHESKDVFCIPNGFDPQERRVENHLSRSFEIVYTGRMYRGRRDPQLLFRSIRELADEGAINPTDLSVMFYGDDSGLVIEERERYGLKEIVKTCGAIPRCIALKKQQEAQILLLLTWDNPKEYGVYTGKLYEYLAAGRPILSIGPKNSVIGELLKATSSGAHVSTLEETKSELGKLYKEFRSKGSVEYRGRAEEIDKYSQRAMARRFAHLLDSLV